MQTYIIPIRRLYMYVGIVVRYSAPLNHLLVTLCHIITYILTYILTCISLVLYTICQSFVLHKATKFFLTENLSSSDITTEHLFYFPYATVNSMILCVPFKYLITLRGKDILHRTDAYCKSLILFHCMFSR